MKWFMRLTGDGVGMHIGILPGYPRLARLYSNATRWSEVILRSGKGRYAS